MIAAGVAPSSGPGIISLMPPEPPQIKQFDGGVVLTLDGELDAYDAPELRRMFEEALATEATVIVLDLAAVTFLDSTVLGAIVGLLRRQREADGELRVVLPGTTARRVFEITGLDAALDVWSSRDEAVSG